MNSHLKNKMIDNFNLETNKFKLIVIKK